MSGVLITMEKSSSSAKTKTRAKGKAGQISAIDINDINEDLLHKILAKLPARSFASAACVSRSWNRICNRILSRPKLSSALSLNPSLPVSSISQQTIFMSFIHQIF